MQKFNHSFKKDIFLIRKRTIIAIIITIIILIATNKVWLAFKPVCVNFNIYAEGKCNIEAQISKKNNDRFGKVKGIDSNYNLNETNTVNLKIKNAKTVKRIRIIISYIETSNPITIKNIKVNNVKLNHLDKISAEGAKILKQDNELVLKPLDEIIILNYPENLNMTADIDFNAEIFIIIAVLTFLFAYKLANYTAEFNTIYKKPKKTCRTAAVCWR